MNWKNTLSVVASAFVGGAGGWLAANITNGVPTTLQGAEAFLGSAVIAGLIAVIHLYQPVPASSEKKG